MSLDRRRFLATGLAAGAASAAPSSVSAAAKSADMPATKHDLSTPALVLDLDRFEANVAKLADHARTAGVGLRPHAKTHKCPEIARRQLAAGALGVSVATVPEAEAMAAAGIGGLLLTSPIVEPHKIARAVKIVADGRSLMLAVGHVREVELLAEAAASAGVTIDVLIDVDVGDHRTGVAPGEPALALAQEIAKRKQLRLRGVQAYAGSASHTVGFVEREARSRELMSKAVETRRLLEKNGFDAAILSGGSTGTYNIDSEIDGMTELQCGSYVVMDVDYRRIGGRDGAVYTDFQPSLTILSTVVNTNAEGRVSIDAGTKAIDTTTSNLPQSLAEPHLVYGRGGDEFGILTGDGAAPLPKLGDRVEFLVPHCDPSINLYDRLYAVRGDKVEGVWPIAARREFPPLVKTLSLMLAAWFLLVGFATAAETVESLQAQAAAVAQPLEGEISAPGLKEPVEVLRDRWGVAHIYARNQDDLFFTQGFVVAHDRLFQLDLWRRIASGETAELVGEKGLPADRFARLMKYRGPMEAEWTSYAPDAQPIAEAFTRGINAAIEQMGDRLPIEFQLLKYRPSQWRAEDVLGRMSGLIMVGNYANEAARAELIAAVGLEAARRIVPTDPVRAFAPLPELDVAGIDRSLLAGYEAATSPLPLEPDAGGSNNWAVDGTLSASGKPLLAGDPHRALMLPSLRYLVHLNAPGWNVIGAGEPALPGVAIGHNDRVAWAFTIVGTDQADLYVEQTNPDDPTQYRDGDHWRPLTIVRESVRVKGRSDPVELELQFTHHGPIIHTDAARHRAFALRWVGSEPGTAAYLASLRLDRVSNAREFVAALGNWKVPALNMTHADVDGNIGWVAAGATPIRDGWDGLLPVPGHAGKYEWQGFRTVAELPQSHNPASHYLATANHNILTPGYQLPVSYDWSPPYRFQQIRRRLEGQSRFDVDDFCSIQQDATTIPGQTLVGLLGEIDAEALDAACVELLRDWDGVLSVESRAAVLYGFWLQELLDDFYAPHVPKHLLEFVRARGGVPTMLAALQSPDASWFGGDNPRAARDRLLTATLATAIDRAKQRFRDFPKQGTWGELHTAAFTHPLARLGSEYAAALNLGPVPKAGDGLTPNAASHSREFRQVAGASYRHVFDLADWDRGLATSTPGQSGRPGDAHYDDLLKPWSEGTYFPLAFSRGKVEEVTEHRLLLKPGAVSDAETIRDENIRCEGTYKHHLQGVCAGADSYFWCFTSRLVKTDSAGKIERQIDVQNHHGDLCFHDGRVYVAVNFGKFNRADGQADSWVYVYDADDLSLVAKQAVPELFYGAGGIAYHDGRFMVVGGLPEGIDENYVYEYDEQLHFVKKHVLRSGHTLMGIQTAAYADGSWWFGCYGEPRSLLKADAALATVERFEFECSLGIVPRDDGTFFVGRGASSKQAGHTGRLVVARVDPRRGLDVAGEASK